MKKSNSIPFIIMALLLLTASSISAQTSNGALLVAVRVLPSLSKSVHYNSPTLRITADDVKRGYVEISDATVVEVRTNSRQGYMISLLQTMPGFKEIWVSDGMRTVIFSGAGGLMHQATTRLNTTETKRLSYRFVLADGLRPGTYSWPLVLNVFI